MLNKKSIIRYEALLSTLIRQVLLLILSQGITCIIHIILRYFVNPDYCTRLSERNNKYSLTLCSPLSGVKQ